jgi:GDPmannose 4,6-dehydratase
MFGNMPAPQSEVTAFAPCSPYGAAKLYAYWMARMYRDAHGFHASNGILFNHESTLRGEEFVTRKIACGVGEIEGGIRDCLILGNLDAMRDWGHARDYMRGAWLMLQQGMPDDYVLATGQTHTVREFVERSFEVVGMSVVWEGHGENEKGIDRMTGRTLVKIDPAFYRPLEVNCLCGDASKAKEKLGWTPSYSFEGIVAEMIEAERLPARLKKLYG